MSKEREPHLRVHRTARFRVLDTPSHPLLYLCSECGAVIVKEGQKAHADWHAALGIKFAERPATVKTGLW